MDCQTRTHCAVLVVSVAVLGCGTSARESPSQSGSGSTATSTATTLVVPAATSAPLPLLPLYPLFEKVVPYYGKRVPVFTPGRGVIIGSRQWDLDGKYLATQPYSIDGNQRVIAVVGSPTLPLWVLGTWRDTGKSDAAQSDVSDNDSFLVTTTGTTSHSTKLHKEFYDPMTVAPDGKAIASREGEAVVIRALPSGAELARQRIVVANVGYAGNNPVCWDTSSRAVWLASDNNEVVLQSLDLAAPKSQAHKLQAQPPQWSKQKQLPSLVCDPSGTAAAVIADDSSVTIVALATGKSLATVPATDADNISVAIGSHGQRLAVAADGKLTVYRRVGQSLQPDLNRQWQGSNPDHSEFTMQFSNDGTRLAVLGSTLVMFGESSPTDFPSVPDFAFKMPSGFRDVTETYPNDIEQPGHWIGQLSTMSGLVKFPHMLVHATTDPNHSVTADVVALAFLLNEFGNQVPAVDASEPQLAAFAKRVMAQLFTAWNSEQLGDASKAAIAALPASKRDSDYTMRIGNTDGKPWVETRELWSDGCEPYDGYTKIVLEPPYVYVVRAVTVPGGSIKGWLEKFFDLPFGMRVQTARRKGHTLGPC
jgi:hypothetical protein